MVLLFFFFLISLEKKTITKLFSTQDLQRRGEQRARIKKKKTPRFVTMTSSQ